MKKKRITATILFWFFVCTTVILFPACTLLWNSNRGNHVATGQDVSKLIDSIRVCKGNAESHYKLGCYLQERKKYKPAIEEFKAALEIDPNHVKAYNGLGVSYDAMGDYDRAVDSYKAALRIDEKLDYVVNNLGYSYLLQGQFDLAIENFKKALELDSGNALYRNNLGLAYAKNGRYLAAFAEFKKTGIEAKAHYNMAQLYYRQGLYKEAEEHFEQASVLKTSDPEIERGLKAAGNLAEIATTSGKDLARAGGATVRNEEEQTITLSPVPAGIKVRGGARAEAVRILQAETLKLYDKAEALGLVRLEVPAMEKALTPEIKIEVSNGNGVNRMARRVGNYLNGNGFALKYLCNASDFRHEETRIYYVKGYLREACRLAEKLPGWQRFEEVAEIRKGNAEISVLIGKDLIPYLNLFEKG
jgi:tetratricopeptide (TPR) repeat protein